MLTAPEPIMRLLEPFRPVFSERVWDWALELLVGAILAPGRRTVTRILRVIGRGEERQFQNYHRVLNRAVWSGLALSGRLLRVLVDTFVPAEAAIVLGADETLERRRGAHIAELGCYRDAARSTARNKVKSMGLRWLSMMLIVPLPWASRSWALPFLTVSAPPEVRMRSNKAILREAMRPLLPAFALERPKQPFSTPILGWFAGPLAGRIREALAPQEAFVRRFLDGPALDALLDGRFSGRRPQVEVVFRLLTLEKWARAFGVAG